MASDAGEIVLQLGLRRPIVIGHSMGGLVTMTLLLDRREAARRLGDECPDHGFLIIVSSNGR